MCVGDAWEMHGRWWLSLGLIAIEYNVCGRCMGDAWEMHCHETLCPLFSLSLSCRLLVLVTCLDCVATRYCSLVEVLFLCEWTGPGDIYIISLIDVVKAKDLFSAQLAKAGSSLPDNLNAWLTREIETLSKGAKVVVVIRCSVVVGASSSSE